MMSVKRLRIGFGLLLAALAAGCGGRLSPPAHADPAQARDALRAALDAWKRGEAPDALKGRRPPVMVIDPEWRGGFRLADFQIQDDAPSGADLRCRVVLTLADGQGRAWPKAAVYDVGTSPAVTVSREED
jgi:hypothetical protein